MSLNGLESPNVQEAHQAAIAEAGGWLLLKYVSRDSVELLGRGKGGVHEARNAIAAYTEPSPLYGLIIYRRRKVLIKYIPEGTGRVLLARTAVHFQDVQERYSPYETLLEITKPEDLNDTSLAASFPLHTATPSASSSRLDEINEDEDEEDGVSTRTPTSQTTSNGSYFGSQRQRKERRLEKSPPPSIHVRSDSTDKAAVAKSTVPAQKPHLSQFLVREESGQHSISSLMAPTAVATTQYATVDVLRDTQSSGAGSETPKATTPTTPLFKALPDVPADLATPRVPEKSNERFSRTAEVRLPRGVPDQPIAERPATSTTTSTTFSSVSERSKFDDDPYDFSRFDIKPKQKFGPRPVAVGESKKRPTVATVSSLPATYKPMMKKPELPRTQLQGPRPGATGTSAISRGLPAPPPIPDVPEYNPRPVSRGSIKSLPSHKSTAMTPDKIRLMKAVELRKKQLRKSNPQAGTFVPPPDEEVPTVPAVPESTTNQYLEVEKLPQAGLQSETMVQDEPAPTKKADSGIEMEYDRVSRREDKKASEVAPFYGPGEVQTEPMPAPVKLLEKSEPQSPKADTPRDASVQSFEQQQNEIGPVEVVANEEEAEETPTPRVPTQPVFESQSDLVSPGEAGDLEDRPTLPMSRHALPMSMSSRGQSIDERRPSKDDVSHLPTIIMGDGSRPLSALIREARSEDSTPSQSDSEEKSEYDSANASGELQLPENNARRQNSDIAKRRRGFVEPLHLDGDNDFTSDEEFMDELQSATLQEAKPITVARSPVAHYFPRRPSAHSAASDLDVHSVRTVTMGDRASTVPFDYPESHSRLIPDPPSTYSPTHIRSTSNVSTEKADSLSSMKRIVSNGTSRRIHTLTENTNQDSSLSGSPSSSRPTSPETSTNGIVVNDLRQQTRSPPPNARNSSFRAISRHSSRISAYQSLMGSTVPQQQPENNTVWNVDNDSQSGVGSVSVTARIVRPTTVESPQPTPIVESEFRPSQLVVSSHKRGAQSQSDVPRLQRIDTNPKLEDNAASRNTSPVRTRTSVEWGRQLHSANKFGRHKPTSPTVDDFPTPPPSIRPQITQPAPSNDDSATPRESTRTSRFFKRMSNIGNIRKSTVAQSIAGSISPVSERGSVFANNASLPGSREKQDLPPALTVGDLNIQFPDSLLWKRRIVEIDDAGWITFWISQAMGQQRGAAKKYQLSEFRMPYVPDLDRQELPNSIMLDFVDGTTLQIACEDSMTHRQVSNVLKSYWRAWTAA